MAERPTKKWNLKASESASDADRPDPEDRMPTKEELLHELRLHGAKPPPPREIPAVSRRTRDYCLLVGIGSALIVVVAIKVMPDADRGTVGKLVMTAVGAYAALLGYIFYGVMGRY